MSQVLLYIFPLILGRTFDMNTMQVGVDIYPNAEVLNPTVIQNPITETTYKIIDSTDEARDLLDVSGSFSLNVKGGILKAGAAGAYMTDVYNRQNTVEVVVRATYETVTETLPPKANPIDTWKSMSGLGTHYVRSIVYGGELIASIRLVCNNTRNKQNIKAALEAGGRIEIFDIGAEVEGEYFSDVSKSVDTMQIKVYSSIPLSKVPHDMKQLKAMLDSFSEDMKNHNDGKGVPLKVELWPLDYLDSTRPQFLKNSALEAHLRTFEQKFDDLLNTKAALKEWMKGMTETLTEQQENTIGKFYAEVTTTLRPFYEVIGKLDMSKGTDQLKPALKAYGKYAPGNFYHRYLRLRQEMVDDQGEWTRERGSGATYIHWGKKNCSEMSETLYSGYAVGPRGTGGGSNFLCLPKYTSERLGIREENSISIEGASYKFPGKRLSHILCSSCRLATRGSAETFVGISRCPRDWKFLYGGLLLNGGRNNAYNDFLCLEKVPDAAELSSSDSPSLVPSWVSPSLNVQKLLPCIVCSK